jgi:hypothetical protein
MAVTVALLLASLKNFAQRAKNFIASVVAAEVDNVRLIRVG